MLSTFPSLLSYQELSPFIIRLVLGITIAYFGYLTIRKQSRAPGGYNRSFGIAEIIIAVFFIVGLFVQVASLITSIVLLIGLISKFKEKALLTNGVNYYLLLFVMSLSLLFTGAGWFAFDMPL